MTGSGGWPMTVFALPDGRPFFAGTYFPKLTRGGHLGFAELCQRIDELWRTRRDDLEEQAAQVTEAIATGEQLTPADRAAREPRCSRRRSTALLAQVDQRDGGFGRAPKFPQTMSIDTLLRHHRRTGDAGHARRGAARPSTPWPPAASTTTSAAGSPATRPTAAGWCPTSRRCSTTRRCWPGSTCTPGSSPASPASARRSTRPSATSCATCATRSVASSPPRTPTPKGSRASSTCGRSTRSRADRRRRCRRRHRLVRRHRGRQLGGHQHPRAPGARRPAAARRGRAGPGRAVGRRGRRGSGRGSTTRSSPSGTPCCSRRSPRPPRPPATPSGPQAAVTNAEFLCAAAAPGRRPVAAHLAGAGRRRRRGRRGQDPRLRRRPRRAGRRLRAHGRAHR